MVKEVTRASNPRREGVREAEEGKGSRKDKVETKRVIFLPILQNSERIYWSCPGYRCL